jgi:hypothetical protein
LVFESKNLVSEKESKEKPVLFDRKSKKSLNKSNDSKGKYDLSSSTET